MESTNGGLKRSCTFCKRRKIKCDRGLPCSSCVRFSNPNCEYLTPAPKVVKPKVRKSIKRSLEEENQHLKEMLANIQSQLHGRDSNKQKTSPYSFNSQVPDLEDLYDLEDAQHMEFDDQFEDLLKLIADNDCDVEFNLVKEHSIIVDREPARTKHCGIFSWKAISFNDPALSKLWLNKIKNLKGGSSMGNFFPIKSKIDADNSSKVQTIMADAFQPLEEASSSHSKTTTETSSASFTHNGSDESTLSTTSLTNNGKEALPEYFSEVVGTSTSNIVRPVKIFSKFKNNVDANYSKEDIMGLKKSIEDFLPPKYIIWELIDLYFSRLYSFFPVVDETDFRGHMSRIFSNFDANNKSHELKVDNKLDFANIGILLFMMRLSYLTLLPTTSTPITSGNREGLTKQQVDILLACPISLEAVSLGNDCVNIFNVFGPLNFTIFQLVLIMRMYSIYGPECGDGPDYGHAALLNSLLFQMAYSLGIHRDPDTWASSRSELSKNLIRKIWSVLLMLDLNNALEYGEPLNIVKYSYDTKLPIFLAEASNVKNLDIERFVIDCFQFLDVSYKPLISLITEIGDLNGSLSVVLLCKKLRYLRYKLFEKKHFIMDFVKVCSDVESKRNINILKFKIQIQFSYFICSLYYYLFLFFEQRNIHEVAFYYFTNLLQKLLLVIFPFYFELSNATQFKPMVDLLLVPGIENMVSKCILFLLSICIRVKCQVTELVNDPNHYRLLKEDEAYKRKFDKLQEVFHKTLEVWDCFNTIPTSYSLKYFYSWIISRVSKFIHVDLVSDDFQTQVYDKSLSFPMFNDELNLSKIIEILDTCLASKYSMIDSGLLKCETFVRNDAYLLGKDYERKQPVDELDLFGSTQLMFDRMNIGANISPESNDSMDLGNSIPMNGTIDQTEIDNIWIQLLGKDVNGDKGLFDISQSSFNNDGAPGNTDGEFSTALDSVLYQELFKDF